LEAVTKRARPTEKDTEVLRKEGMTAIKLSLFKKKGDSKRGKLFFAERKYGCPQGEEEKVPLSPKKKG